MNSPAPPDPARGPLIESDPEVAYTLDLIASMCGLTSETVLHYLEQCLIRPAAVDDSGERFDDETVHRLRRIEQLRSYYGMEGPALKLSLCLMDEVERLRA